MRLQLQVAEQPFQVKHLSGMLLEEVYNHLHQVSFPDVLSSCLFLSHGDVILLRHGTMFCKGPNPMFCYRKDTLFSRYIIILNIF